MFERGPAFETRPAFRGNVLAGYSRDENPLDSGYLLHPERIQGKAAALEVFYGDGPHLPAGLPAAVARTIARHVQVLLQRDLRFAGVGQTHSPGASAAAPPQDPLRTVTATVRGGVRRDAALNRAFFAAHGPGGD